MKFSIVVPVYNVAEYLEKCLKSISHQSYKDYEVIIVNDGSTDNSEEVIDTFLSDKRFLKLSKENGGLSDARNYGVAASSGDYLLFIDGDDYIDTDLLMNINNVLKDKKYDMVKFNFVDVVNDEKMEHKEYINESKEVSINDLIPFDYFEPACGFAYNLEFYKKNKFMFTKNRYHEDYGLIPIILTKAESIYYLNMYGYYYVERSTSIVNNSAKSEKRAEDTYYFSMTNIEYIKNNDSIPEYTKALLLNFYASGAIHKLAFLKNKRAYRKKLKEAKIEKYLLDKTIKQKIKKAICQISYSLFIKLF